MHLMLNSWFSHSKPHLAIHVYVAADKSEYLDKHYFYFSTKIYVVGTH